MIAYRYRFIVNSFIETDLLYSNLKKVYEKSLIVDLKNIGQPALSYSGLAGFLQSSINEGYYKEYVSTDLKRINIEVVKVQIL